MNYNKLEITSDKLIDFHALHLDIHIFIFLNSILVMQPLLAILYSVPFHFKYSHDKSPTFKVTLVEN